MSIDNLKKIIVGLGSLILSVSAALADGSCDTCQQLSQLNTTAQNTETNTATSSSTLNSLLQQTTYAFSGSGQTLGNGNIMAAFSIMPQMGANSYNAQATLLHTIETEYQGNANSSTSTMSDNYSEIFHNYLLQEEDSIGSFNEKNASVSSLYLDPSQGGFYTDDQQVAAETYIKLASGVAMSSMQKPSSDWLTINPDHVTRDQNNIRRKVGAYYTFSALQSAIADNFAYIYSLNKGEKISGSLENYSGKSISQSGILNYIETQKTENPNWYSDLGGMGILGLLREQTILLGGCFVMLMRIEEDLRRLLITNSVQTSVSLIGTQQLTDKLNQSPQ